MRVGNVAGAAAAAAPAPEPSDGTVSCPARSPDHCSADRRSRHRSPGRCPHCSWAAARERHGTVAVAAGIAAEADIAVGARAAAAPAVRRANDRRWLGSCKRSGGGSAGKFNYI